MTAPFSPSTHSSRATHGRSTQVDVLFVHNNFPGQFKGIAQHLAQRPDMRIHAIGTRSATSLPGAHLVRYGVTGEDVQASHSLARRFEFECRRAEQVIY